MDRRRALRLIGAGTLLTATTPLLAACQATGGQRFVIRMTGNNRYEPATLEVPRGATVIWQNAGTNAQSVTCDPAKTRNGSHAQLPGSVAPWDSENLYAGDTWTRAFDTPGAYVYFSRFHEAEGMIGTITVKQ